MKPAMKLCLTLGASLLAFGVQAQSRYTVPRFGGEVTDSRTGLIWMRCVEGMTLSIAGNCTGSAETFTHEAALQRAAAVAGSTGKAWRLPNVKELSSIADKSRVNPAIDTAAFPATPTGLFWSSSPYVVNPDNAWWTDFYEGLVGLSNRWDRWNTYHVRLVRAGE